MVNGKKVKDKKKSKKIKIIPKKVKILCKKYHIRLTTKKGSKRIKKNICILLRELKKKIKGTRSTKGTNFGKRRIRQKRHFGEGEEKSAEVEKKLSRWAKTKKYAKEHPKKFAAMIVAPIAIAGAAVIAGPAILAALAASSAAGTAGVVTVAGAGEALAAGTTALTVGEKALHGASTAKTLVEKEQQLSKTAKALSAAQKGLSTAAAGTGEALTKVKEGVEKLQEVKGTVDQIKNAIPPGKNIEEVTADAKDVLNQLPNVPTSFGKRNLSRFGENFKKYPQFGKFKFGNSFGHSNYIPKPNQVMNFGMTKQRAIKIIRDLYRKNCKKV